MTDFWVAPTGALGITSGGQHVIHYPADDPVMGGYAVILGEVHPLTNDREWRVVDSDDLTTRAPSLQWATVEAHMQWVADGSPDVPHLAVSTERIRHFERQEEV